ncbi:S41 family peptidase [Spirulina major CS-329]|nr:MULTISPECIES: carboxyl-terminal processing protease CtpC [Spirulina]MDB9494294.1 S41 family peptidase [Spirulina subsalsa CS-330]MDB9504541.1 S41 family peptidase [Spirulina major CS-329]
MAVTGAGLHLSQGQILNLSSSPKEVVDEVWQIINRYYVDATFNQQDWRQIRTQYLEASYGNDEEAYTAIREMLETLDDPYTRFMDPKEFEDMQIDTSGSLTGVGIQIAKDEESDRLIVVSPIDDSPAFNAGIIAKDIITKIDGQDTLGMEVNDAVQLIRGERGTEVILTIQRGDREIDFPIVRDRIEIHPVRTRVEETRSGNVAYIRLTQFNANAAQDMREALRKFEAMNGPDTVVGYVLDLRSNPGGLLNASVDIARMWLDEGKIVSTHDRRGEVERQVANNTALTDKPLVVMIDGGSASASEIVSAALQDNQRAMLIGTESFGKGLVQSVRPLSDGSGLAVTIAEYRTPNGRSITKDKKIQPDVVVELSDEEREELQLNNNRIGTVDDPQFARSLEVLLEQVLTQSGNQLEVMVR